MHYIRIGKLNVNMDQIAYFTNDKPNSLVTIYFGNPNLGPIEFSGKEAEEFVEQYRDLAQTRRLP